jgi:hypothetical protein
MKTDPPNDELFTALPSLSEDNCVVGVIFPVTCEDKVVGAVAVRVQYLHLSIDH